MIVKGKENDLLRCLRSVKPLVHEMIVVDTGSADRTKTSPLSSGQGLRVSWENDFRRRETFHLPGEGDWILALDADE
jgi:glycosyltransferase involved in cell wall biosynthesis